MNGTTTPEREIEIVEFTQSRPVSRCGECDGTGKVWDRPDDPSATEIPCPNCDGGSVLGDPQPPKGPRFAVYVDGCFRGACNTRERADQAAAHERDAAETVTERAIRVMKDGLFFAQVEGGDKAETTDEESMVAFVADALRRTYPDKPEDQHFNSAADLVKLATERPDEEQEIQPVGVTWHQSIASMDPVDDISMWHTGGGCLAGGVKLTGTDAYLMVTDEEMGYDTRPDGKVLLGAYPNDDDQEWIEDLSGEADDFAHLIAMVRGAVAHLTN